MNILHISPYVPSLHANHAGGVCMGKVVESLRKNHNVFVLSFINDEHDKILAKKEFENNNCFFIKSSKAHKIFNALFHPLTPLFFSIRSSYTFKRNLVRIINDYNIDAIHAEFTSMGQYVWIKRKFPQIQFNLVEHDVTKQSYDRKAKSSKGIIKIFDLFQAKLVNRCEKKYCKLADNVLTFNEKDKLLLETYYGITNIKVLVPYFGLNVSSLNGSEVSKTNHSICFVGNMSRIENELAANRLINIVSKLNNKDVRVNIIGANPSLDLLNRENNIVHITGFVDDIEKEIVKNQIAVFPLTLGAGIKLKVLLACALGLPVITSKIGAEGIDEEGKVLILAESDEDYLYQIQQLLMDPNRMKDISSLSKSFVMEKFDWNKSEIIFNSLY